MCQCSVGWHVVVVMLSYLCSNNYISTNCDLAWKSHEMYSQLRIYTISQALAGCGKGVAFHYCGNFVVSTKLAEI
jgi:hypothetical protein